LKIQELSQKTGLTVYTIRFYEKEGLFDSRHVVREENNYRNYAMEAIERVKLIKKFQNVGCSLVEIKEVLKDHDSNMFTNHQVIEWIQSKISEINRKKEEYDQILHTLQQMLEYRTALESDPCLTYSAFAARRSSVF
jgi:MerR family transcriptional regulator, copper efflux regulator